MEGATLSGRQTSARINEAGSMLHELRQRVENEGKASSLEANTVTDELTFV